jgi:hypothetical protein
MTERRVLIVSPHFPPDGSAGAHRARVVAPYLAAYGWRPVVLTVAPASYEGTLDAELAETLAGRVEVIRVPAWRPATTRRVGLGDLGLRAFVPLYRAARTMTADAVYLTTYPIYPAAFGPRLKRRLGAPLIVDLQDPWVGEWGSTVGGGLNGRPDWKSRVSRSLAVRLEHAVLPEVDALTGVSSGLLDDLAIRHPTLAGRPRVTMPIGIDQQDFEWIGRHPRAVAASPRDDGRVHACYVGTLLPLGLETLDAVLMAVDRAGARRPALREQLRLHFVGTSNQSTSDAAPRVLTRAAAAPLHAQIVETPGRIPYLDALRVLSAASIVLVLGTSEARYTASKVPPALASGRPLLAVVHAASDVARVLAPLAGRDPAIALLTYDDRRPVASLIGEIGHVLETWATALPERRPDTRFPAGHTGPEIAQVLATLLDRTASEAHTHES